MKRSKTLIGGLLTVFFCSASLAAGPAVDTSSCFHSAMPAGYEVVLIKPTGAEVSLLGLIECPELEGAQHVAEGINSRIVSADGNPISHFPRNFSFRVTASLRKTVLSGPSGEVSSDQSPQDFLLNLKFKLNVYDGLDVHEVQPESVQMIGVPADVPYDERVYRISFNAEKVPVTDRFVLEVLSPEGERLTRFHFDLL
jgi:hypothetical protein